MQSIAGSIHHGQPEDRAGKFTVVHHGALRRDLVVIVCHPRENLAHDLDALWGVEMQTAAQLRLFRERQLLQRTAFCALRNGYRAVHVDAAQHDYPSRRATEDVHQIFRLRTRTDDQVNHDIGSKALQFLSAGIQLVTVAPNLVNAMGCGGRAAMKHRQRVSLLL